MTLNSLYRRLGLALPENPVARDSHLFQILAERTAQSDAELRSQRAMDGARTTPSRATKEKTFLIPKSVKTDREDAFVYPLSDGSSRFRIVWFHEAIHFRTMRVRGRVNLVALMPEP